MSLHTEIGSGSHSTSETEPQFNYRSAMHENPVEIIADAREGTMVAGRPSDPMITTERLALRPWRIHEADRLFDIRRRPEVAKWLGSPEPWTELSDAYDAIDDWAAATSADDPLGSWAIVPNEGGAPAGTINLGTLPRSEEVHIGWVLHPDSTGHGYASEGAAAVLEHAIDQGVPRVWAIMWPENEVSVKVAGAIGMTDLGVVDDPWFGSEEFPKSRMFRRDPP